jgi:hypothetical protein
VINLIIFVFVFFIGVCIKFLELDKQIKKLQVELWQLRNWSNLTDKEKDYIAMNEL